MKWWSILSLGFLWAVADPLGAQSFLGRAELAELREELIRAHAYDGQAFDEIFSRVQRLDRVIALMDAPLRAPVPWPVYWPRHIGGDRFQRGREFLRRHAEHFERAEARYGVPRSVIAAIIGVETVYGRITGTTRVIDALATLAFDYPRRSAFFRSELKEFLLLCRELGRSPLSFQGSFAGALGWPQFMPGSYRRHAVDFDGDGRIDLWDSPADIIGSVAAFLHAHGWRRGEAVMLPLHEPSAEVVQSLEGGLSPRRSLQEWRALGIRIRAQDPGVVLPGDQDSVGIISLDLADGRQDYWLVFENFYVITRYNRSRMYASAVWSLAYAFERAGLNLPQTRPY